MRSKSSLQSKWGGVWLVRFGVTDFAPPVPGTGRKAEDMFAGITAKNGTGGRIHREMHARNRAIDGNPVGQAEGLRPVADAFQRTLARHQPVHDRRHGEASVAWPLG